MFNTGLDFVFNQDVQTFTSDKGIKIRRFINPFFRRLLRIGIKRRVHLESYPPQLDKKKAYVFVSNHFFDEDAIINLSYIKQNVWLLAGTTEQIMHNPSFYFAWLNGLIYVDRFDKESRTESLKKMERILEKGSSVLLYPEGGWNNTENLLVQPFFAGAYVLAAKMGCEVVPVVHFHEHNSKDAYLRVGEPLDLQNYEKDEALRMLRDSMASMQYEMMECHSKIQKRKELLGDCKYDFMHERKMEYLRLKWSRDVWEEELTFYHDKYNPLPHKVRETLKDVHITYQNAWVMAPILQRYDEDRKYNFLDYMRQTWSDESI